MPEAARLLRPGGQLVFLVHSFLLLLCSPPVDDGAVTPALRRSAFGIARVEWPDNDSVEFYRSHGEWIRLLRRAGFEIEALVEVRPPDGATTHYPYVTLDWAQQWPCEEIWKVRRRA